MVSKSLKRVTRGGALNQPPPRPIRHRLARRRRRYAGDAGFTLIEVLVATTLALVVVGGPLTFLIVSIKQQNVASSRSLAARQGELGLERLVRDLRGAMNAQVNSATALTVAASSSTGPPASVTISFSIPSAALSTTPQTVTWVCTVNGSCTRTLGTYASGTHVSEITGVTAVQLTRDAAGHPMTLPATNPDYIGVTLGLQVTSQLGGPSQAAPGTSNPIMVQTGVDLRNFV